MRTRRLGAIWCGRQRVQSARCERSGVRGRTGHGLFAHRRQRSGKGVLWRRPGRVGLLRFHRAVSRQIWALEFTQVPVRRELRDDTLGRARQFFARDQIASSISTASFLLSQILNFDDSADAPQFNPGVGLAVTSWRCRPTRPPPGYHQKLSWAGATARAAAPGDRALCDETTMRARSMLGRRYQKISAP